MKTSKGSSGLTRRGRWTLAVAAVALAPVVAEFAARASGAVDFPLYVANNEIGYIHAPLQQGSFLNRNDWSFNTKSMAAGEFAPSPTTLDVLLVGDSLVNGGNKYRLEDRLGPRLAQLTGLPIWPIAAGSWSLRNELIYLRQHPDVVAAVDAVVFVLNSEDFEQASSWDCDLLHPRERPALAVVYLFRKYIRGSCEDVQPAMKVPAGDWRKDLAAFLATPGAQNKPILFFLFPGRDDLTASWVDARARELRAAGATQVHRLGSDARWTPALYRDGIHPTPEGYRVLASIIWDELRALLPASD